MRTAFFPDSYLEVNGAAMTCRRLTDYAKRNGYPFLCIYADKKTGSETDGSITNLALKRSPVSFSLDEELAYDPLFHRHVNRVLKALRDFKPDVIHITGLNDVSIIGAYLAWRLNLPMVGSWHTNLHEFAAHRITNVLGFLPSGLLGKISNFAEKNIMKGAKLYYKMPKVILAPNQELIDQLTKTSKRKAMLMTRGVDINKFSPEHRTKNDGIFRLGFVGRLRAEKNVRLLIDLEKALLNAGKKDFEFVIIGEGSEREHLEKHLKNAVFTGFLDGQDLSEGYANMDLFIFPSKTDAFGNVAQEALASAVPAIVTDVGGPKFIIEHNKTGFVATSDEEFVKYTIELMENTALMSEMKRSARDYALSKSWDSVFETVFSAYQAAHDLSGKKVV